jgi:hypothetical protein
MLTQGVGELEFTDLYAYEIPSTLRTGDADLRLYAYKQFKYPVPNVLGTRCE